MKVTLGLAALEFVSKISGTLHEAAKMAQSEPDLSPGRLFDADVKDHSATTAVLLTHSNHR
jgi:hypothetical protein